MAESKAHDLLRKRMPSLLQNLSAKASETAIVSSDPARVAGSDAAKPMAKTTDLNVEVVDTARRNYSPIPLVAA